MSILVPLYLLILFAAIRTYAAHPWMLPFQVTGAQGAHGHPLVIVATADSPIQVGDAVLAIAGQETQGLSATEFASRAIPAIRSGEPLPLESARNGQPISATVRPRAAPPWWVLVPAYLSVASAGLFLLLRAPHWHLSRRFFVASMLGCMYFASELNLFPKPFVVIGSLAQAGAMGLALSLAADWRASDSALRSWRRAIPWVLAAAQATFLLAWRVFTVPAGSWPYRMVMVDGVVLLVLVLAFLARAYLRSNLRERRQLRWVSFGFYVGFLPYLLFLVALSGGFDFDFLAWQVAADVSLVAIPGGIVVSVLAYQYLDIDRLISASACLTVLAVVVIAGALVAVPRLADAASDAFRIDPETGQLTLSLAIAAVLVPAYRVLRPLIDRSLFAEHHAVLEKFERLLTELAGCLSIDELARSAGQGIDGLLGPDSIATYARAGDAFTPIFVRGSMAPPAFERRSALVHVLEERGTAIVARAKGLSPFDRATLETLGAEVVVPVRRGDQLVAFTCLATKRSGDIYTPTDVALLTAVAERCSDVLARLDANAVASEAEKMQASLRRYVPGAIAKRLLAGGSLEPGQREVTVLFVDIRDYTQLAEGLAPADVFATLNEHTERVSSIVQEYGGTIVEFNGDGMMAVFGAPDPQTRKEARAVEAARRIVDSMPRSLRVGIGVSTGSAFVGSIRSSDRLIWTAVGTTTNLASRLQALTRQLDASIAIDDVTFERAGYVCANFVRHGDLEVRGHRGLMNVHALPLRARGGQP